MQQAAREIQAMTERLESSGFERDQADAVIETVANAIEKFAVTPERLRKELERNNEAITKAILQRMDERFEQTDKRIDRLESLMKLVLHHTDNVASVAAGAFRARRGRADVGALLQAGATRPGALPLPPAGRARKRPSALLSALDVWRDTTAGLRRASGRLRAR